MIATISQNLTAAFLNKDALAGWDVQADTNAGQPVADFQHKVAHAPIDQSQIKAIGKLTRSNSGMVPMQETGPTTGPQGSFTLFEMDPTFLDTTTWKVSYRRHGSASDPEIDDE